MVLAMNNKDVSDILDSCQTELDQVKTIIDSIGYTSNIVPFLTKYSVVRACGTIEIAFKSTIADFCNKRAKQQLKNFINVKIRDNSCNPSYSNICRILKDFDQNWIDNFKKKFSADPDKSKIETSLQSLVDARNEFAHGGDPSAAITDVLSYFKDSRKIIEILDDTIS